MNGEKAKIDVLCVGHACHDLVFSVDCHPEPDDKIFASSLLSCGGGPAANAAVAGAKLGYKTAFCGYLGRDLYGAAHMREFESVDVRTELIVRGEAPTPLSAILVKPDGKRSVINYRGDTRPLPAGGMSLSGVETKAVLFDGHEPDLSAPMAETFKALGTPTILDAGSVHRGTLSLINLVTYVVASEKFARQFTGADNEADALRKLADVAPHVVITLGHRGLIWQSGGESGRLDALPVEVVDSTGAGDAFHGAFAAGVSANLQWEKLLLFSSAAGALCCQKIGARPGLPSKEEVNEFLKIRRVGYDQ